VVRASDGLSVQPINRLSDLLGALRQAPATPVTRPGLHALAAPF